MRLPVQPDRRIFAYFDKILKQQVFNFLVKSNENMTQNDFIQIIHKSIHIAENINFQQIYRRTGLLEE